MIISNKTRLVVVNGKFHVKVNLHGVSRREAIERLEDMLSRVRKTVVE